MPVFPFWNGFPLLPHLSHNDGKKVDLAFYYYDDKTGEILESTPSPIGYGAYAEPQNGEKDQPQICRNSGYWFYNLLYFKALQPKFNKYTLDEKRTELLAKELVRHDIVEKVFIEPHLATRMNLYKYNKVRYHGCHAVRHDDHIHVQVK